MGWRDIFRRRKNPYYGYGYGDYYDKEYWEAERQKMIERNLTNKERKEQEEKEKTYITSQETGELQGNEKTLGMKDVKSTSDLPKRKEHEEKTEVKNLEGAPCAEKGTVGEKKEEKNTAKRDGGVLFVPVRKEKKDIIIFAVESSSMVNQYKNEIGKIISKIVSDNDRCLFLFLRVGNDKKYFDIMDYDKLTAEKTIENLFVPCEDEESNVDYLDALKHIDHFLSPLLLDLEYKDKKYDIQNKSVIFFGTGTYTLSEQSEDETRRLIKRIKIRSNLKTIRYFCIKDSQTVKVAALGFPVIGHIVADFYK